MDRNLVDGVAFGCREPSRFSRALGLRRLLRGLGLGCLNRRGCLRGRLLWPLLGLLVPVRRVWLQARRVAGSNGGQDREGAQEDHPARGNDASHCVSPSRSHRQATGAGAVTSSGQVGRSAGASRGLLRPARAVVSPTGGKAIGPTCRGRVATRCRKTIAPARSTRAGVWALSFTRGPSQHAT